MGRLLDGSDAQKILKTLLPPWSVGVVVESAARYM